MRKKNPENNVICKFGQSCFECELADCKADTYYFYNEILDCDPVLFAAPLNVSDGDKKNDRLQK